MVWDDVLGLGSGVINIILSDVFLSSVGLPLTIKLSLYLKKEYVFLGVLKALST